MADPWELILHHSYAGTPGVVFDSSPGRAAHGRAIDIDDNDFLPDGVESGSGVIDFRNGGLVRASVGGGWRRVDGMRVEVACLGDPDRGGTLIAGDKFSLSVSHGYLNLYLTGDTGIPSDIVRTAAISLSFDTWTTLGFVHDGFSRLTMTQDGNPIFSTVSSNILMGRTRTVTIGSNGGATPRSFAGLIDDVKVWRVNPHRVDDEFVGRPADPAVRECWRRWSDALAEATKNDPDCMKRIITEIRDAVRSLHLAGNLAGGDVRRAWDSAAESYRSSWTQGEPGSVVPALADLVSTLRIAQIDPADNAAVRRLAGDPCLKSIAGQLPSLDCDPDFTGLIGDLDAAIADIPPVVA